MKEKGLHCMQKERESDVLGDKGGIKKGGGGGGGSASPRKTAFT